MKSTAKSDHEEKNVKRWTTYPLHILYDFSYNSQRKNILEWFIIRIVSPRHSRYHKFSQIYSQSALYARKKNTNSQKRKKKIEKQTFALKKAWNFCGYDPIWLFSSFYVQTFFRKFRTKIRQKFGFLKSARREKILNGNQHVSRRSSAKKKNKKKEKPKKFIEITRWR